MSKIIKKTSVIVTLIILMLNFVVFHTVSAFALTGKIYLNAYSYYNADDDGLGHAFITIENDTYGHIYVGRTVVGSGYTVSVGLWGNIPEHDGVWYNAESYAVNSLDYWDGRVSLRTEITVQELNEISDYILVHDYWNLIYNCSVFVKDIWNMVSDDTISCGFFPVNTPDKLARSIKEYNYYEVNRSISNYLDVHYYDTDTNSLISCLPELDGSTSSNRGVNEYELTNQKQNQININNTSFSEEDFVLMQEYLNKK